MIEWALLVIGIAWAVAAYAEHDPRAYFGGIDLNKHYAILLKIPNGLQRVAYLGWVPVLLLAELMLWGQSVQSGLGGIALIAGAYWFIVPWFSTRRLLRNELYQRLALMLDMKEAIEVEKVRVHMENGNNVIAEALNAADSKMTPVFYQDKPLSNNDNGAREKAIAAIERKKEHLRISTDQIRSIIGDSRYNDDVKEFASFLTALGDAIYLPGRGQNGLGARMMKLDLGQRLTQDCLSGILSAFPNAGPCVIELARIAYSNGARSLRQLR